MSGDQWHIPSLKRLPLTSGIMDLAKQVRFGEVYAPSWVAKDSLVRLSSEYLAPFRKKLEEAELIDASELCELFYTGADEEEWNVERDLPKIAPPFPVFWIEMKKPSRIVSRLTGIHSTERLADRWGYLFERLPMQKGKEALEGMLLPPAMERAGKLACHLGACAPSIVEKQQKYGELAWRYFTKDEQWYMAVLSLYRQNEEIKKVLKELPETGCMCGIHLFFQIRGAAFGPMGAWTLLIGPEGKLLFRSHINAGFVTDSAVPSPDMLMGMDTMLSPALFAVQRLLYEMAANVMKAVSMNKN